MDIFTAEMSSGLIKTMLIRPIARIKIYLAKVSAVGVFVLAHILFVAAFAGIFSAILGQTNMAVAVCAYLITFVPLLGFIFVAALVAQFVKNGLLGMLLCIFFTLACYALEVFFTLGSAFVFTRHLSMYKLLLTENIQASNVVSALLIIAAYVGVTFTAGYLLFERKEF